MEVTGWFIDMSNTFPITSYSKNSSGAPPATITYAVGPEDATLLLLVNVNVLAAIFDFSIFINYTDETNIARVMFIPFVTPGSAISTVVFVSEGTGVWSSFMYMIRTKAGTTVSFGGGSASPIDISIQIIQGSQS
jgi:hypothetical protein